MGKTMTSSLESLIESSPQHGEQLSVRALFTVPSIILRCFYMTKNSDEFQVILDVETNGSELQLLSDTYDTLMNDLMRVKRVQETLKAVAVHDHSIPIPLRKTTSFATAIPVLDELSAKRESQLEIVVHKIELTLSKLDECRKKLDVYSKLNETYIQTLPESSSGQGDRDHIRHVRTLCRQVERELAFRIQYILEPFSESKNLSKSSFSWDPIDTYAKEIFHDERLISKSVHPDTRMHVEDVSAPQPGLIDPDIGATHSDTKLTSAGMSLASSQSPILLKHGSRVLVPSTQQPPKLHDAHLPNEDASQMVIPAIETPSSTHRQIIPETSPQRRDTFFETFRPTIGTDPKSDPSLVEQGDDSATHSISSQKTPSGGTARQTDSTQSSQTHSVISERFAAVIPPSSEPSDADTPLPLPRTRSLDGRFPFQNRFDLNSPTATRIPSSSFPVPPVAPIQNDTVLHKFNETHEKENVKQLLETEALSRAQSIRIEQEMWTSPVHNRAFEPEKGITSYSQASTVDTCSNPNFHSQLLFYSHKSQEIIDDSAKVRSQTDILEPVDHALPIAPELDEEIIESSDPAR